MHAASLHIEYPMLFKVENRRNSRSTHCGVLEFIADEGMVYMPYWVRNCLFHLVSPFSTLFVLYVLSLLVTATAFLGYMTSSAFLPQVKTNKPGMTCAILGAC